MTIPFKRQINCLWLCGSWSENEVQEYQETTEINILEFLPREMN